MLTDKTCSVCLQSIEDENICTTDCHHEFCKECLDNWFNRHKLSCPLCRKNIEYFYHKNNIHRIVCVIREINREQPNQQNIPYVILTKKIYNIMNIITSLSVISTLLMGYFYSECKHLT